MTLLINAGSHPRATINRRAHKTKPDESGSTRRARVGFEVALATFVLLARSLSSGRGWRSTEFFNSIIHRRVLAGFLILFLGSAPSQAFDPYLSPRLGLSLATLQNTLEKVAGPVIFAPRPDSQQGTQEARLAENAGIIQAGGEPENLAAVVLWLPVDARGQLAGAKARPYLNAFVELFTRDSEPVVRWVEAVLERAVADPGSTPHLESQLFTAHQFKATYMRTLSPAMLSLTVISAEE